MTANEFAAGLKKCAPSREKMLAEGLSEAEANQFLASFLCSEDSVQSHLNNVSNPVLDLINRFDVSTLEIGMITFLKPVVEIEQRWLVGKDELLPIVINQLTEEVTVEQITPNRHTIQLCARSGGNFLAALLSIACFLGKCSYDTQLYEDDLAKYEQARKCAELAGGERYRSFYQYLLGV